MSRRLGFLGPAIVVVGMAVAALGGWWMLRARPQAGELIDALALGPDAALVVRAQVGSARNFVELRRADGRVAWQALVPQYAGRPGAPGLAASAQALSVRVVRDGGAEMFGLSMRNAAKLGGLKLSAQRPPDPAGFTLRAAVTLSDGATSFELVGVERGPAPWAALAAVDLESGRERWHAELGATPIEAAGLVEGGLWLRQGGEARVFSTATGAPLSGEAAAAGLAAAAVSSPPGQRVLYAPRGQPGDPGLRVVYEPGARQLVITRASGAVERTPWPAEAHEPWPYHFAGGVLWLVFADRLQPLRVEP